MTNREPFLAIERNVDGPVTLDVLSQLWGPIGRVSPRLRAVLRACVPEAAVDEDRHAHAGKDYVGPYNPIG